MTDEKNKPVLDQQSFEKLLEAAHVLQKHSRKMREVEERMESHSQRLREQEAEVPPPPAKIKTDPEETERSSDYTLTLGEIVEAQRQIQVRHLPLDQAMAVVAEKVAHITHATGAAIGILEGKKVRYRAGSGSPALPVGSEVPLTSAICAASIRTGQVIRSEDVNTEVLFDPEPCRERGILSLLAVPIYHDGDIVGALELYFDQDHGYGEQDIHTCRLLAGLVTEAMGRVVDVTVQKSVGEERHSMAAAVATLDPNLAALAEDRPLPAKTLTPTTLHPNTVPATTLPATKTMDAEALSAASSCWKCGGTLVPAELFCGKCGAPRVGQTEPDSLQSKLASAWHMQQASHENSAGRAASSFSLSNPFLSNPVLSNPVSSNPVAHSVATDPQNRELESDVVGNSLPQRFSRPGLQQQPALQLQRHPVALKSVEETGKESAEETAIASNRLPELPSAENNGDAGNNGASVTPLLRPQPGDPWSSAAKTRDFLESLSGSRDPGALARFWRSRRGDFYLAVAVILVLVVFRWGVWSNHAVSATNHSPAVSGNAPAAKQPAADANLSAIDKLLISLGLAEAPEPPEYKGNPETEVWVDLHTALYYCPGAELYNKTPKGKLTSQRDAQLDQFVPADRKPCD